MKFKNKYLKIAAGAGLLLALVGGVSYYYICAPKCPIVDFVNKRDTKEVLKIFYDDWYWLFPGANYSPEFILKYHSPGQDYPARYQGKLNIKVLREQGKVAGFTTYFKLNFYEGKVQFVAVSRDFRRRGYGRALTEYSTEQLFKMGCAKVSLLTRIDNVRAQRIYERIGFKETSRDDTFVYYSVTRKSFNPQSPYCVK